MRHPGHRSGIQLSYIDVAERAQYEDNEGKSTLIMNTSMKVTICSDRPLLTGCGLKNFNYQVDTYVGCEHYCYYCYVLGQAETDWSKEILIHDKMADRLSRDLEGISPQTIYMGYHADPYQPCEVAFKQTRIALECLLSANCSASLLTKSDLFVRDIDLLEKMEDAAVSVSVAFVEDDVRTRFEANTISTDKRIAALAELKRVGIKTGALICPVIPHITDVRSLIESLEPVADQIWVYAFSAIDREEQSWKNTHQILQEHYPDQVGQIEHIIFSKQHDYWKQLRGDLATLKEERNLSLNIHV